MILITHTDLDGAGCAVVARHFYQEQLTKIFHVEYDTVEELLLELLKNSSETIIMADISMNKETAAIIQANYSNRFEIFDHHQTSFSYLSKYPWANFDMSCCATKLFFNILKKRNPLIPIPENLEKFVFHVNDVDLWLHNDPSSMFYNDLVNLFGVEYFVQFILPRLYENEPLLRLNDTIYLNGIQAKKQHYFKQRTQQTILQGNRLIVIASRYISELCQYLRDNPQSPEWKEKADYIDVINLENKNHSLRSYRDDFDVSKIAESFGGGGHKKAAGYQMNPNIIDSLFKSNLF